MTRNANNKAGPSGNGWRITGWGILTLLLLLPLVAMQFTDEVQWTAGDFIFAGLLLGSVGLGFEFIARKSSSLAYRSAAALAVIAAFLTIWVNAAVGMIGDGPYNLLFGGVLLTALCGAIIARFEPAGMVRAMVATAVVQAALSAIGLATDLRGGMFSMTFGLLWLLSAALFRNAARTRAGAAIPPA